MSHDTTLVPRAPSSAVAGLPHDLGAYWLLTGALVFEADTTVALVAAHLHQAPIPPSQRTELEIPADLEELVLDCLEKQPAERPPSAGHLARRLASCRVPPWTDEAAARWWQTVRPREDPVGRTSQVAR